MHFPVRLYVGRVTLLLACVMLAAAGLQAEQVYLVSGTPGQHLPVRLYKLDTSRPDGALNLVSQIADDLNSVLVDYRGRKLVILSPSIAPTLFSFIGMDTPDKVTGVKFRYDSPDVGPGGIFLLKAPGGGDGVALALDKVAIQQQGAPQFSRAPSLAFISPNSGDPAQLPFRVLSQVLYSGEAGVVLPDYAQTLYVFGDPPSLISGSTKTDFGVSTPPYLKGRANSSQILVSNDEIYTLTHPDAPSEPVIDVLDKSSNTWRRVPMPFRYSRFRTFGHWLATIEMQSIATAPASGTVIRKDRDSTPASAVSPGAAKRAAEQLGPAFRQNPGLTADDLFDTSRIQGTVFPGELFLYNLASNTQFRISTGSGDSEIVFANDNEVFYRVDDALFRRDISGSGLGQPVKLAEGIALVQVHWAFLK